MRLLSSRLISCVVGDVSCVSVAQQVWSDKGLPEPHIISLLAKSANVARELICASGLADDANKIVAEMFFMFQKMKLCFEK